MLGHLWLFMTMSGNGSNILRVRPPKKENKQSSVLSVKSKPKWDVYAGEGQKWHGKTGEDQGWNACQTAGFVGQLDNGLV